MDCVENDYDAYVCVGVCGNFENIVVVVGRLRVTHKILSTNFIIHNFIYIFFTKKLKLCNK